MYFTLLEVHKTLERKTRTRTYSAPNTLKSQGPKKKQFSRGNGNSASGCKKNQVYKVHSSPGGSVGVLSQPVRGGNSEYQVPAGTVWWGGGGAIGTDHSESLCTKRAKLSKKFWR